ncbi:MAG: DEAD/DEAH box helicase [Balneolaceae bacterium]
MKEVEPLSFEQFGLSPELLSGLADIRIKEPTPLQHEVIPSALQGKHLLVKHEAEDDGVFLIPALHKLSGNGEVSGTRVLILTPSIERAKIIDEAIWAMGYHAQISSVSLSMKGNREEQEQALRDGAPMIVANPGRLIEILEKNKLTLSNVELIIIDEAHNMENYNLVNRVKDILNFVEGEAQSIILSSEYNKASKQLAELLLKNPDVIGFDNLSVEENASAKKETPTQEEEEKEKFELDLEQVNRKLEEASVSVVLNPEEKKEEPESVSQNDNAEPDPDPIPGDLTQAYIYVPPRAKISTLLAHLEKTLSTNIVVFAASKRTTDRLFRIIRKKGWGVVSIDERLTEQVYNERFEKFTSGNMKILLVGGLSATDVELDEVKQVINYDVPNEVEEYKYRAELVGSGKAARMVSLVSKMDKEDINEIVKKVGYAPTEIPLPEEVKEKKKGRAKSNKGNDNRRKVNGKNRRSSKNDDRQRKKVKKEKNSNGLPRPTYEGLSGGRDGKKKRPAPGEGKGAFGWIKKLFD